MEDCSCPDEGSEDLLSGLAVAFLVVVSLLVGGGLVLLSLARRLWRRRVEEAVRESRSREDGLLGTREEALLGSREEWGRSSSLPPPYSLTPSKPPTPSQTSPSPPAYTALPPSSCISYSSLISTLQEQVSLQSPGVLQLLQLLETDPEILLSQLKTQPVNQQ